MKKMRFFCLILACFLIVSGLKLETWGTPYDLPVTRGCHSVDAAFALSPEGKITETARAVMLYDLNSDTMLYTWNPDERIYPTSMVKLMAVLVALENSIMEEEVTVTRRVLDQVPIGSVSAGLKSGEVISMGDLLYCAMVASANDAVTVAAAHIAGTTDAFVQMMNDMATALGCKDTHYSNVHGIHDVNTYSTARDICRITEAALQNKTFRTMFETSTYTVPATNKSEAREIHTTNFMMSNQVIQKYYDDRVTGGKTGATDAGGRCLTLTAKSNGMEILCVVMGAKPTVEENGSLSAYGSFEESKILLDYAFDHFEYRQVFYDGQSLTQYPVQNGANDVVAQAAISVSTVMPKEIQQEQLQWVYQPIQQMKAPIEMGDILGSAEVWYGNICLAQTDMVAMNQVKIYQTPVVPEKPDTGGGSWEILILLLLGVAFVFCVLLFSIRGIRVLNHKHKQNQRRRNRK